MKKNKILSLKNIVIFLVALFLFELLIFFWPKFKLGDASNTTDKSLRNCITQKKKQNKGFFSPGDLMVTFTADTDIMEAQNLLAQHGLLAEQDFVSAWLGEDSLSGLLLVHVPSGEEFHWWCVLEQDEHVANVKVNRIANRELHPDKNK